MRSKVVSEAEAGRRRSFVSSFALFARARAGDAAALSRLFRRVLPRLRRWTHGRLPSWARQRADTEDIVHDALLRFHRNLPALELRRRDALGEYLRQSIRNRIRDETRRAGRVETAVTIHEPVAVAPSPYDETLSRERAGRYLRALERLDGRDQELIVGRLELGLSYEQLALAGGKPSPDAARVAVARALKRLSVELSDA